MPPVGFGPTISAGERRKTYALDRVATGTGNQRPDTVYKVIRQYTDCTQSAVVTQNRD